jgi:purine-binding chemotaxis protein CheW
LDRTVLVFELAGETAAIPIESAHRIVHMTRLDRPPGLPGALQGVLNLAGTAVPVLRLERVLGMRAGNPGLFSMLIVLKGVSAGMTALLVDRVSEVLSISDRSLVEVSREHSFNAFAEAAVIVGGRTIHLLSPERILLEGERQILSDFQAQAQRRLQSWQPGGIETVEP